MITLVAIAALAVVGTVAYAFTSISRLPAEATPPRRSEHLRHTIRKRTGQRGRRGPGAGGV